MSRKQSKTKLAVALFSLTLMLGGGTVMFHYLENWTWSTSFYFSVTSLTTVGIGDVVPTTDETRVITAIYILIGVGIVLTSLGYITSAFLTKRDEKIRRQISNALYKTEKHLRIRRR